MRATRAYMASLGTTGLLLLSAFAILAVASALLAFNGWPGLSQPEDATPVVVRPGADVVVDAGPEEVAAEAAALADQVAAGPAPAAADTPAGITPAGGTPDVGPGRDTPRDDLDTPVAEPPPSGDTPVASPPSGTPGGIELPGGTELLRQGDVDLVEGVADGVESFTGFLGDRALTQVSPELGFAVSGTGDAVTDVLRGVDAALTGTR